MEEVAILKHHHLEKKGIVESGSRFLNVAAQRCQAVVVALSSSVSIPAVNLSEPPIINIPRTQSEPLP